MFILNVDLWSKDGAKEVNLVRHSAQSPAIGNTIAVSFVDAQPGYAATGPLAQHYPRGSAIPQ